MEMDQATTNDNESNTYNIPKPLPLINQQVHQQSEPKLIAGQFTSLKRKPTDEEACPHLDVSDWHCKVCNSKVPQFSCIFDDYGGKVKTFMRVIYENEFLLDFLNDYLEQGADDDNEDAEKHNVDQDESDLEEQEENADKVMSSITNNANTNSQFIRLPEVIYQQYQPSNSSELREYMLFLICKQLKKQQQPLLGGGQARNLSNKLIKYLTELDTIKKKLITKYNNDVLLFDSIFESGNLLQAEMVRSNEYQLYMQVDTNTKGHQQWFYFRIMNFTKPSNTNQSNGSGQGAKKPELLQKIHYKSKLSDEQEWKYIDQHEIEYIKTKVQRRKKDVLAAAADSDQEDAAEEMCNEKGEQDTNGKLGLNSLNNGGISNSNLLAKRSQKRKKAYYYYALQFEFEFQNNDDTVYFAFAVPTTYSNIISMLIDKEKSIESTIKSQPPNEQGCVVIEDQQKCLYYKRQELCRSICGLPMYSITVGRDSKTYKKKPVIAITTRVHAGETPGSQTFQGFYDFITSDACEAKFLRKFYTFLLLPILNPDGVICGNYRNSVAGVDLNRQWIAPDQDYHPEIYHTKNLFKVMQEKEKRNLYIYCDMHGHSKKKNSFFYGCNTAANGGFLSWTIVRLLPRIFAKKTHFFNYKDCRFKVEPYKLGTGRVVTWKQFMVTHSFTLESSFYGYDYGEDSSKVFTEKNYQEIGSKLCLSIYELHFLWKQIRKELQVTNGWLKPRKLIELTGVPAAQILHDEIQKKRKDEQKKKAIELYEQFLQRFYNASPKKANTIKTQQVQIQNFSFKAEQAQTQYTNQQPSQQQQQAQLAYYQNNNKINIVKKQPDNKLSTSYMSADYNKAVKAGGYTVADITQQSSSIQVEQEERKDSNYVDQLDYEDLFQKFQGIVKIQAWIRGFLTRKRVIVPKPDDVRPSKQGIPNGHRSKILTSPVFNNSIIQRQVEKQNTMESELGELNDFKIDIDWRQYFQEQELDEAFQNVEIDKVDDPNDGYSSGSNSQPSLDNLDQRDMMERIYEIDNMTECEEERQNMQAKFIDGFMSSEQINQLALLKHLEVTFSNKRDDKKNMFLIKNRRNTLRSPQKTQKEGGQTLVSDNLAQNQLYEKCNTNKNLQQQKDNIRSQRKTPYYQQFYLTGMQIDNNILKKSNTQSPMTNDIDFSYPLIGHSMLEQDKRNGISQKQYQIQQQRSQLNSGQNIQNISYLHMKLLQQQQAGFNYKENMNQVIKDCFITKKCGTTQQRMQSQINKTKQQNEPIINNRLHSFNTYKGLISKPGQQKRNKKMGKQKQSSQNQDSGVGTLQVNDDLNIDEMSVNNISNINTSTNNIESVQYNAQINDTSQSSLFMRYVKSKIVKKLKQDSIPPQVADKYLNIYKELIDRERKKTGVPYTTFNHVNYQKDLSSRSDLSFNPRLKQNMQKGKASDSYSPIKINRKLEKSDQSYNIQPLKLNQTQDQFVYNNNNGNNSSNTSIMGGGDTYFRQNNNNSYLISAQDQAKIKLPLISNFSSTLDYKKKSREIINELKQLKSQQNQINQSAQAYNAMVLKSYDEQVRTSYQDNNENKNIQDYDSHINNNMNNTNNISIVKGAQNEVSIQSSIDQDMISNIKNIYQEMKQNTKHQQYNSTNQNQKQAKSGFLKQKRLQIKNNTNDELMNMLPPSQYDDIIQQYQQQSIGIGSSLHSKSVMYGHNQQISLKGTRNVNNISQNSNF